MILFVDASALTAIIRQESDAASLTVAAEAADRRIISALAVWETVRAVARGLGGDMDAAAAETDRFLSALDIRLVPVGAAEATEAIRAHVLYGKGTRHPARLNMGDCFAYACARTNGARLLYKGDDFAQTDMAA